MKKVIATLLTLCMVLVVIPSAPNGDNDNQGISLHAYSSQAHDN